MNISKMTLLYAILMVSAVSCQDINSDDEIDLLEENMVNFNHERIRNGKIKNAKKLPALFSPASLDTLDFPTIDEKMILALEHQLNALEKRKSNKNQHVAGLDLSIDNLRETIQLLIDYADRPEILKTNLSAHQIWGKDKRGHVNFTGYYTPIISVKKEKDDLFKYPLYAYPDHWVGDLPSRREIDSEGVLSNQGLEIAYASSPVDIYYMQVQGSGYIKFVETGEKLLLRYDGSNGRKYRSIETYMAKRSDLKITNLSNDGIKKFLQKNSSIRQEILNFNPSYTFFKASKSSVQGAGGVPLMADISIAADTDYFPIGSVALASIPVYNKAGKITHHEYRIVLPQDVGGAVRGAGHVDIYSGVGSKAKKMAGNRHHYGRMWLLLPQDNKPLALN